MDEKQRAKPSEVKEADIVFVKWMQKRTKFDTNFNQEPCVVTMRTGSEAEIQTAAGNVCDPSRI